MNKKLITIALFAGFALSAQAEDQFFKWVDERGITHYSQSPPDDSKIKAELVNVRTRIPMDSEAAISKLEKQRSDNAKAKSDDKEDSKEGVRKTGDKAVVASSDNKYKEKCEKLRQDLQTMSDKAGRIKVQNDKGEVHTMTEEERLQRIDETQKQIKGFCEK
jgi:hypothetical protein